MGKKTIFSVLCLLAVLALGLSRTGAGEAARPELKQPAKPDGKLADMTKPVKVFILMGQSNMVGFGAVGPEGTPGSLETLVKKQSKYPFLVDDAGKWLPRNDLRCVFMLAGKGMQRNDWLQPGFGAGTACLDPNWVSVMSSAQRSTSPCC